MPLTMNVSPPLAGDEGGVWAVASPARSIGRRNANSWQRQTRRSEPTADCAERCARTLQLSIHDKLPSVHANPKSRTIPLVKPESTYGNSRPAEV